MEEKTCPSCNERFSPSRSDATYCSDKCRAKSRRERLNRVLSYRDFAKGSPALCGQCSKGATPKGEETIIVAGLYPVCQDRLICRSCAQEVNAEAIKSFVSMREVRIQDEKESSELAKLRQERAELAKVHGMEAAKAQQDADQSHDALYKQAQQVSENDPRTLAALRLVVDAKRVLEQARKESEKAYKALINMAPAQRPEGHKAAKALSEVADRAGQEVERLESEARAVRAAVLVELIGDLKPRAIPVPSSYEHPSVAREQERKMRDYQKGERVLVGNRLVSEAEAKEREIEMF